MTSTQGAGRKAEWIEKLESTPHLNYNFLEGIVNVPSGLSSVGLIPDCIFLQSIARLPALETRCTHCSPIVEVTETLRFSIPFLLQVLIECIFFLCVASSPSIPLSRKSTLG